MSHDEARQLLANTTTISLTQAAELAGISERTMWQRLQDDESPFPVLRHGRKYRFPSAHVARILGIDLSTAA
jgi:excisionase family DNA binding protein